MSLEGRGEALGGRSETQSLKVLLRHLPLQFTAQEAKALVAQRTRGGLRESAATLWTLSVTTTAPPALAGTSISQAWGLLMTAVLRTCPGAGVAEIKSKHNWLSGSQLPQVNFPHTVHGKKQKPKCPQQDRMLRIPNYCRNANQNGNKRSSPIRASSGGYTKGKRAWGKGTPLHSRQEGTLTTSSIMDSL